MSRTPEPAPQIDMSEAAINERIAEVVALNRLCDSLAEAKPLLPKPVDPVRSGGF